MRACRHHRNPNRPHPVKTRPLSAPRRGFTLIELLVVVALIALLLSLAWLALGMVTDRGREKGTVALVRDMESDDLSRFANLTYARGFLKLYSQFLGLDIAEHLSQFSTQEFSHASGHEYVQTAKATMNLPAAVFNDSGSNRQPGLYILLMLALAGGGVYWWNNRGGETSGSGRENTESAAGKPPPASAPAEEVNSAPLTPPAELSSSPPAETAANATPVPATEPAVSAPLPPPPAATDSAVKPPAPPAPAKPPKAVVVEEDEPGSPPKRKN